MYKDAVADLLDSSEDARRADGREVADAVDVAFPDDPTVDEVPKCSEGANLF